MRVYHIVLFAAGVFSTPIAQGEKRGLLDILEGDAGAGSSTTTSPVVGNVDGGEATAEATNTPLHHLNANQVSTTSTHTAISTVASLLSSTQHPIEGVKTKARSTSVDSTSPMPPAQATPSMTGATSVNSQVGATPPGELAQWKVIGISIICVTFVAIIIMAVTFFDTWWAFVRDIVGCGGCRKGRDRSMQDGREVMDLAPNWNRRTWEFKLANEDGHRYPTLASMESMIKVQGTTASSR